MTGVIIPIYFNTPETDLAETIGIDRNMDDADIREVIFYSIAAVGIYKEGGREFGRVYCNGEQFVSPWSMGEINDAIKNAR